MKSTANTIGWLTHSDSFYCGIDVRLRDVPVHGDLMQMIFAPPMALASSPTSTPTLERLN